MLCGIATHHLDVDKFCTLFSCDTLPFAARELNGIAGIGHNTHAEPQVVSSYAIGEPVPFTLYLEVAEVSQSLLDRIDSQVNSSQIRSQVLG
jgi:hypothetical protein